MSGKAEEGSCMAQNKYKRRKFFACKRMILQVTKVLKPYGGKMTAFTERAVGVVGDDRLFGPGVVIQLPAGLPQEEISRASTDVTNHVRGVIRVLVEIQPEE